MSLSIASALSLLYHLPDLISSKAFFQAESTNPFASPNNPSLADDFSKAKDLIPWYNSLDDSATSLLILNMTGLYSLKTSPKAYPKDFAKFFV